MKTEYLNLHDFQMSYSSAFPGFLDMAFPWNPPKGLLGETGMDRNTFNSYFKLLAIIYERIVLPDSFSIYKGVMATRLREWALGSEDHRREDPVWRLISEGVIMPVLRDQEPLSKTYAIAKNSPKGHRGLVVERNTNIVMGQDADLVLKAYDEAVNMCVAARRRMNLTDQPAGPFYVRPKSDARKKEEYQWMPQFANSIDNVLELHFCTPDQCRELHRERVLFEHIFGFDFERGTEIEKKAIIGVLEGVADFWQLPAENKKRKSWVHHLVGEGKRKAFFSIEDASHVRIQTPELRLAHVVLDRLVVLGCSLDHGARAIEHGCISTLHPNVDMNAIVTGECADLFSDLKDEFPDPDHAAQLHSIPIILTESLRSVSVYDIMNFRRDHMALYMEFWNALNELGRYTGADLGIEGKLKSSRDALFRAIIEDLFGLKEPTMIDVLRKSLGNYIMEWGSCAVGHLLGGFFGQGSSGGFTAAAIAGVLVVKNRIKGRAVSSLQARNDILGKKKHLEGYLQNLPCIMLKRNRGRDHEGQS